uniref:Uncharacterized protein n=1 Tax=Eutreptiella gymnastica TaxID=73025 RepID=A0A7S1N415_9EUGL|mmetsp:Transcript_115505/g.201003  ORF Transcript_115505/g.201003 Transcript_115505/m.201003 type:complete len:113 (+) Transcript_115505:116-454(+)
MLAFTSPSAQSCKESLLSPQGKPQLDHQLQMAMQPDPDPLPYSNPLNANGMRNPCPKTCQSNPHHTQGTGGFNADPMPHKHHIPSRSCPSIFLLDTLPRGLQSVLRFRIVGG